MTAGAHRRRDERCRDRRGERWSHGRGQEQALLEGRTPVLLEGAQALPEGASTCVRQGVMVSATGGDGRCCDRRPLTPLL